MANIQSAKKRMRQDAKRRLRNRAARSVVRTQLRRARAALESGDREAAVREYHATVRALDRGVTRGVLHRNTAARHKSRLAAKVNQLAASAPQA